MSRLLILGAGGHAKVVAETALASGVASSVAFLDDRCTGLKACLPVLGWPVMGPLVLSLQAETAAQFDAAVVAIGHAATYSSPTRAPNDQRTSGHLGTSVIATTIQDRNRTPCHSETSKVACHALANDGCALICSTQE